MPAFPSFILTFDTHLKMSPLVVVVTNYLLACAQEPRVEGKDNQGSLLHINNIKKKGEWLHNSKTDTALFLTHLQVAFKYYPLLLARSG